MKKNKIQKAGRKIMRTYNASKLNLWKHCELKFCAYYLLGYKEEKVKNPHLELGSLIHKFFEDFYKQPVLTQQFKNGDLTLEDWKKDFSKTWNNVAEEIIFKDNSEKNAYKEKGLLALNNFFEREKKRDFKIPIFLEEPFIVDLGQFKLNGKIDRVDREEDGSITILDYKTGKVKSVFETNRDLQLTIYHLACEETILKETPKKIGLYYPVQDEIIYTERENKYIELISSNILEIDLIIEQRGSNPKEYKTSPADWKCEYCAYREQCPEHKVIDYALMPSANEIIEKTERYSKLKAQEKELKDEMDILKSEIKKLNSEIKEYMKKGNISKIGKCKLTPVQKAEYDAIKLWDLLKEIKDGYQYIKINKKALEEDTEKLWGLFKEIKDGYQYIKVNKKALEEDIESFSIKEKEQIKNAKIKKDISYNLNVKKGDK
jgi:hypothetical protein